MPNQPELYKLFSKYLDNACTPAEITTLLEHFHIDKDASLLKQLIAEEISATACPEAIAGDDRLLEDAYKNIIHTIRQERPVMATAKKIPLYQTSFFRVAAVFILVASGLLFWYLSAIPEQAKDTATTITGTDILPGGNKATLTLADGSVMVLDSAGNGLLASQAFTKIIKHANGVLVYDAGDNAAEHTVYNTVTTPRGGQYNIVLPDGSKVWLNAASSLRFPSAFTGKERLVTLTGEAYFEVAKNKAAPFKVHTAGQDVEVLGTHFNMMAYEDEAMQQTTLLEGAVQVRYAYKQVLLKPGQQSALNQAGEPFINTNADIEQVMAWKNGLFQFEDAGIQTVMRQIARWYDVTIVYAGSVPASRFGGQVSRNSNLSQVLKILELSGVHFRIEGKTITVL